MPTHYDALGVPPTASAEEIRRAYQRLALQHHPDKVAPQGGTAGPERGDDGKEGTGQPSGDAFLRVQAAWETLRQPAARRAYDASLLRLASAGAIDAEVDLDDMEFRESPEGGVYVHACRCGGEYAVSEGQLERGADAVGCGTCSLRIRVLYRAVD
ncbi:DnaJ domain-containing protein [Hyaloraphidium curvatum]|nr:DnaJ domain-containing protein [Hyaloraphidium curvatum]